MPNQQGRGRPKNLKRSDVIERATDLYWREGYQTLSLNEVCRRLSVSKPALYREFGGETGLIEAVLAYYRVKVIDPVLAFLNVDLPFKEGLEGLIVGMTEPQEFPPGCLFTEMRIIRRHLAPQVLKLLELMEEERRDAFARWYDRSQIKGEVNSEITPMEAADFIDAQFTLILLNMGIKRDPEKIRSEARLAFSVLVK